MVIRETNYSVTVNNAIFNLKRTKIIDSRKILHLIKLHQKVYLKNHMNNTTNQADPMQL